MPLSARTRAGCLKLLEHCGAIRPAETVLIVCDPRSELPGRCLEACARSLGARTTISVIDPLPFHGAEPPAHVAALMAESDLICAMTTMSLAHSRARRAAAARGARFLSLPDYSLEVLGSDALTADFRGLTALADGIAAQLEGATTIRVTGAAGTDLEMVVRGRRANSAPGWVRGPGALASPPDAEVNIAPLEGTANGCVIVDGSIPAPGLGLLDTPIRLDVENGRIRKICGGKASVLARIIEDIGSPVASMLGEVGWGLNPKASLTGCMLADEGTAGTAHFGFGSNLGLGGATDVPFHLDCVIREAVTTVDGRTLQMG